MKVLRRRLVGLHIRAARNIALEPRFLIIIITTKIVFASKAAFLVIHQLLAAVVMAPIGD
jgi:hypothetical protein